ncbi:MAG: hypothetical protein DDT34_00823 [Firmicutes bacterium]|nr:hypothetical protein [Bacillota bacterium]
MNKILAIIGRDLKSGTRDWLIIYLSLASILVALLLRALIPSVGESTLSLVVLQDISPGLLAHLDDQARVSQVQNIAALRERVLRIDDVFGVVETDQGFEIVRQGNENIPMEAPLRFILNSYGREAAPLPMQVAFSDVGWRLSPIKLEGGTLLIIFTTVFGGMLILLNLVEEKMSNTLSAINVAPLHRSQFIIGKGILGFIIPIIGGISAAMILGFSGINISMFLVTVVAIAFISIIIGFSIGVLNNEPIAAISSMKMVYFPILASIFGAMFLPSRWLPILYWSPFYWAYDSMRAILLQEASWGQVSFNAAVILALTGVVFMLLRKKIQHGLQ